MITESILADGARGIGDVVLSGSSWGIHTITPRGIHQVFPFSAQAFGDTAQSEEGVGWRWSTNASHQHRPPIPCSTSRIHNNKKKLHAARGKGKLV